MSSKRINRKRASECFEKTYHDNSGAIQKLTLLATTGKDTVMKKVQIQRAPIENSKLHWDEVEEFTPLSFQLSEAMNSNINGEFNSENETIKKIIHQCFEHYKILMETYTYDELFSLFKQGGIINRELFISKDSIKAIQRGENYLESLMNCLEVELFRSNPENNYFTKPLRGQTASKAASAEEMLNFRSNFDSNCKYIMESYSELFSKQLDAKDITPLDFTLNFPLYRNGVVQRDINREFEASVGDSVGEWELLHDWRLNQLLLSPLLCVKEKEIAVFFRSMLNYSLSDERSAEEIVAEESNISLQGENFLKLYSPIFDPTNGELIKFISSKPLQKLQFLEKLKDRGNYFGKTYNYDVSPQDNYATVEEIFATDEFQKILQEINTFSEIFMDNSINAKSNPNFYGVIPSIHKNFVNFLLLYPQHISLAKEYVETQKIESYGYFEFFEATLSPFNRYREHDAMINLKPSDLWFEFYFPHGAIYHRNRTLVEKLEAENNRMREELLTVLTVSEFFRLVKFLTAKKQKANQDLIEQIKLIRKGNSKMPFEWLLELL